jgi:integrase/recombinase XerD
MTPLSETDFKQNYQTHIKHLKFKWLQPKKIEAYAHDIRRVGEYFDEHIENLSEAQLTDYLTDLLASHSLSSVKFDLYRLNSIILHAVMFSVF